MWLFIMKCGIGLCRVHLIFAVFDISTYESESPRCNFCCFLFFKAIRLKVNPLYLMIPGTIGCSYAFMLPVSTPPNSIAFSSGHLMVKDMVSSFRCRKCWKKSVRSRVFKKWMFRSVTSSKCTKVKRQKSSAVLSSVWRHRRNLYKIWPCEIWSHCGSKWWQSWSWMCSASPRLCSCSCQCQQLNFYRFLGAG